MSIYKRSSRLALSLGIVLALFASACGVKGPPLPPIPDTPEESSPELFEAGDFPPKKNQPKKKKRVQSTEDETGEQGIQNQ